MLQFYLSLVETEEERSVVERLYNDYEQLMYKCAYSLLKNEQAAEDAVHEAFLKIIKNISKFSFDFGVKTEAFLVIIVRNICFDMLRNEKRIVPDDEIIDSSVDASAQEEYLKIEEVKVEELIEKLPSELRDVIVLRYIEEIDTDTVSKLLNLSHSGVYKRIKKARDMIKEFLEEE